jgi:hypothetical protein
MCVRDFRIYSESLAAQLFHYRDDSGREIDAVIELPDGKWSAFGIKLGANQVEKAAKDHIAIKNFMEADLTVKATDVLCVICCHEYFAYTRENGVMVVPIAALKQ